MFKNILVPLDGSERAEAILPYVEELTRQNQGKLFLLQVIDPWDYGGNTPNDALPVIYNELINQLTRESKEYLAKIETSLRQQGIEVQTLIHVGSAVSQIMAAAQEEQVDLIAMVSHGRTGLRRVFYGSVAAGVLHVVDRPLLLVRTHDD
ncbi:MAG: universal stress protein [Anaerolineae bacterium]